MAGEETPRDGAGYGMGVVGLGSMGKWHVRGVVESDLASLVAVADEDADRVKETASSNDCRGYGSVDELLADPSVDGVSICLPHHLHHPVASQAIAAGKDVFLEKPLAVEVSECDDLIAQAKAAGAQLSVAHNQVFDPAHQRARQLVVEGALGTPTLLRLRLGLGKTFGGWRLNFKQAGGALLFDAGVHRIYLSRYLFGDAEVVGSVMDVPYDEGEELAIVTLRFSSGAIGIIEASFHGPKGSFDDSVELVGTKGIVQIKGLEAPSYGHPPEGPPMRRFDGETWHDEALDQVWSDSVIAGVVGFCEAVATGQESPVSAWDGREAVRLARDAYSRATLVGRVLPAEGESEKASPPIQHEHATS